MDDDERLRTSLQRLKEQIEDSIDIKNMSSMQQGYFTTARDNIPISVKSAEFKMSEAVAAAASAEAATAAFPLGGGELKIIEDWENHLIVTKNLEGLKKYFPLKNLGIINNIIFDGVTSIDGDEYEPLFKLFFSIDKKINNDYKYLEVFINTIHKNMIEKITEMVGYLEQKHMEANRLGVPTEFGNPETLVSELLKGLSNYKLYYDSITKKQNIHLKKYVKELESLNVDVDVEGNEEKIPEFTNNLLRICNDPEFSVLGKNLLSDIKKLSNNQTEDVDVHAAWIHKHWNVFENIKQKMRLGQLLIIPEEMTRQYGDLRFTKDEIHWIMFLDTIKGSDIADMVDLKNGGLPDEMTLGEIDGLFEEVVLDSDIQGKHDGGNPDGNTSLPMAIDGMWESTHDVRKALKPAAAGFKELVLVSDIKKKLKNKMTTTQIKLLFAPVAERERREEYDGVAITKEEWETVFGVYNKIVEEAPRTNALWRERNARINTFNMLMNPTAIPNLENLSGFETPPIMNSSEWAPLMLVVYNIYGEMLRGPAALARQPAGELDFSNHKKYIINLIIDIIETQVENLINEMNKIFKYITEGAEYILSPGPFQAEAEDAKRAIQQLHTETSNKNSSYTATIFRIRAIVKVAADADANMEILSELNNEFANLLENIRLYIGSLKQAVNNSGILGTQWGNRIIYMINEFAEILGRTTSISIGHGIFVHSILPDTSQQVLNEIERRYMFSFHLMYKFLMNVLVIIVNEEETDRALAHQARDEKIQECINQMLVLLKLDAELAAAAAAAGDELNHPSLKEKIIDLLIGPDRNHEEMIGKDLIVYQKQLEDTLREGTGLSFNFSLHMPPQNFKLNDILYKIKNKLVYEPKQQVHDAMGIPAFIYAPHSDRVNVPSLDAGGVTESINIYDSIELFRIIISSGRNILQNKIEYKEKEIRYMVDKIKKYKNDILRLEQHKAAVAATTAEKERILKERILKERILGYLITCIDNYFIVLNINELPDLKKYLNKKNIITKARENLELQCRGIETFLDTKETEMNKLIDTNAQHRVLAEELRKVISKTMSDILKLENVPDFIARSSIGWQTAGYIPGLKMELINAINLLKEKKEIIYNHVQDYILKEQAEEEAKEAAAKEAAAAAAAEEGPAVWRENWDERHGKPFYVNVNTGISQWKMPPEFVAKEAAEKEARETAAKDVRNWKTGFAKRDGYKTEQQYWINPSTRMGEWNDPSLPPREATDGQAVKQIPNGLNDSPHVEEETMEFSMMPTDGEAVYLGDEAEHEISIEWKDPPVKAEPETESAPAANLNTNALTNNPRRRKRPPRLDRATKHPGDEAEHEISIGWEDPPFGAEVLVVINDEMGGGSGRTSEVGHLAQVVDEKTIADPSKVLTTKASRLAATFPKLEEGLVDGAGFFVKLNSDNRIWKIVIGKDKYKVQRHVGDLYLELDGPPRTWIEKETADAATEEEQRLALAAAGPPDGKWGALPTLKEDGNGRILSSVLKFINVSTWKKVQKATRTKYLMAINGETSITDEKFFKAAVEFGDIPIDKQSHGKPDVLGSHWGKTGHARPINIYETALLMIFHEEDSEIVPPKLVYKTYCKLKASPVLELGAAGDDLNKWNIKVEEQIEWLDGL